ncbi:MAG: EAL domain-containing protein [Halieaceae bacterium]|jgi:predicted signal transduction protein with EAL and GGDEF domain|nr:EAL domain-containing protein [Halieaceae bacterium]
MSKLDIQADLRERQRAVVKEEHSGHARVLVADDDMNVRLLTRQCLEPEGIEVIEAADGHETLELFIHERPDLVFLDVQMPGMTGLEVCRRIRALPQGESVPIMIVTGSDDRQSVDDGFEAGATQYKTKPLNWSLLGRDIQYMLRASNAFNALKRQEDRLRYLAYFDPLTSLPNRRSFTEQLHRLLKRARRHETQAALLFIDLDNFKRINDSIGHARGDRLLVEIAKRLASELREEDAVNYLSAHSAENSTTGAGKEHDSTEIARLGGDEFTIVLSDIRHVRDVERVAQRVLQLLSEPIPLDTHNPVVTPSIGIAIFPDDGHDADELVRNADRAMYAAKGDGRACYRFYNEEMNARSLEQLKLEEDLREALRSNQLSVHYQPQVDARTGRVVSLEALVRWRHPERGMISPGEFIPVAERTGQIIEVGEWVLSEVARQCREWDVRGIPALRMCVNISSLQFNRPDLVHYMRDFLSRSRIAPTRLELELTESAIMSDGESNVRKLEALKGLRVEIAVDDFGTGYSSLNYLRKFPIDTLKIDQSFIADLDSADGAAIVDAIIALSRALNIRSIAEGIETPEQLAYLLKRECDLLQGYYLARPLPAEEIPEIADRDFAGLIEQAREQHP